MNHRGLGRHVMALFALVPLVTIAHLVGCSSSEPDSGPVGEDASLPPARDAAAGVGDAGDAGPCADCEFYPADCGEGRFCTVSAPLPKAARLRSISGTSASSVWVVGTKGTVLHFDGTSWQEAGLGVLDTFSSVLALSPEEAWTASTFRTVYVHVPAGEGGDGGDAGWQPLSTTESGGGWVFYQGVIASSYAAGGPAWFAVQDSRTSVALTRAQRTVDGIETTRIASVPVLTSVFAIHAVSKDELWAVGGVGRALRVRDASGTEPMLQSFNTQTLASLHGVWASGPDDVWAVGSEGTIRRYRGSGVLFDAVPDVPVPADVRLRAITGTGPDDIWAVGDGAVVLHFDGVKWTRIAVAGLGARRPDLHAVYCAERGRVWVAGDGVLLSLGRTS